MTNDETAAAMQRLIKATVALQDAVAFAGIGAPISPEAKARLDQAMEESEAARKHLTRLTEG